MSEVSTKPYLLRAIYEWCVDQGLTPHLAVLVDSHVRVPASAVKGNQVVLNVSPTATDRLQLGNEVISFQARFGGQPFPLSIPVENVLAIYARENGQGMAFEVAAPQSESGEPVQQDAGDEGAETTPADTASDDVEDTVDAESETQPEVPAEEDDDKNAPPPRGGGRPHLKVVK